MRALLQSGSGRLGLALVAGLLLLAAFGPWLLPFGPNQQNLAAAFTPPLTPSADGPRHLLGTDNLGRDLAARLLHGARLSLVIGFGTVGLAALVGIPLGAWAGWRGGRIEAAVMRGMDVLLAFPAILLAIAVVAVLGASLTNAMLAIAVVTVPIFARLTRAVVLEIKERDFVQGAWAQGATELRIVGLYLLPNCLPALLVQLCLSLGVSVLDAAALSFLGLGARPPTAEWGTMLGDAFGYFQRAPWCVIAPGLALFWFVLAFNLLADGLRDALDAPEHPLADS